MDSKQSTLVVVTTTLNLTTYLQACELALDACLANLWFCLANVWPDMLTGLFSYDMKHKIYFRLRKTNTKVDF